MSSASDRLNRFTLQPDQAKELSDRFGTPLYVVSEEAIRLRIRAYRSAFHAAWPRSEISYASKANSTLAIIALAYQEGCGIDVASEGELRAAMLAGVPASACHLHGNNKSAAELRYAIDIGIGRIVADHFSELKLIARFDVDRSIPIVLRLAPGVDPITHAKVSTGQSDTKFGFNIGDGSAKRAVNEVLALGLNLHGFHCHVGSQLLDPEAQIAGGELIAKFAVEISNSLGYTADYLNLGGGLGVEYEDGFAPIAMSQYNERIVNAIRKVLDPTGLAPTLAQEPGRSLVAEAGVTLYEVGVIKTVSLGTGKTRAYVSVNGGLADNPRPALYGSKYPVDRIFPPSSFPKAEVTVSGRHCETDQLFTNLQLPANLKEGELLQVLCTGAYNSSMASNYNRYPRPATVLVRSSGQYELIQRPESWDEMFARESMPLDLGSC